MTATTFVATTAEGNTVARTSSTRDYNFVILAKHTTGSTVREDDDVEGAWGWSGDKANAEKTATTARKAYKSVRVVAVEQKLTGKDAKLVLDAIKAAPVQGSGSQYQGGSARNGAAQMGIVETTKEETVTTATKPARKAKAVTKAKAEEMVAEHQAANTTEVADAAAAEFEALLADLRSAQERVADLLAKRNGAIDTLISTGTISGPKLAKIMGVTPMAVYNMRAKATA